MGYLKSLATTFVWVSTILAAITFLPGLPPNVEFSAYEFKFPMTISQDMSHKLDGAERMFEGEIKGPEAFASYDGVLYTSLHGGTVSKLVGDKLVTVVKFGEKCDGFWEEEKCGRPLSIRFDKQGKLYVVDTYYGIFKVDVKTGKYERIVDISVPIEGKVPILPNAIDVASNGDFYWTISSHDFKLSNGLLAMACNPSGRLMYYNSATKKNVVLLDNLGFPNGVKLSDDESFVLIAETLSSRIIKYHLKGPQAGKSEILIESLPGGLDNIDSDGHGNFLVSIFITADEQHPLIYQSLAAHPNLRKMFVRTTLLLAAPFQFLHQVYPNYYTQRIVHLLGHIESASVFFTENAIVLRIDQNGKIIDVLETSDGNVTSVSSAYPFGDYLYLGSPCNEYLARVKLDKVLPDLKKNLKSEPQVIKQIPIPNINEQIVLKPIEIPTIPSPASILPDPTTTTLPPPTITTKTTTTAAVPPPVIPTSPPPMQAPKITIEPVVVPVFSDIPVITQPMEVPAVPTPMDVPVVPKPTYVPVYEPAQPPIVIQPVEKPQVIPQQKKHVVRDEM